MHGLDGRAESCWRWLFLLVLAWCTPQALQAQTATEAADQFRRQSERESQLRQQLEPQVDVRLSAPQVQRVEKLPRDEQPCFPIQDISLITGTAGSPQQAKLETIARHALERIGGGGDDIDSPYGVCLGTQGIAILQQRAQAALLARGYITSRTLVEPQNLSSGRLLMRIVPGTIEAIRIETASPATVEASKDKASTPQELPRLLSSASPARPGDLLNLRDLEQALENLKRVPSAEADIKIEPGQTPATSVWAVRHQQSFPLRMTLSLDDGGSPGTGVYQGSATVSWDAPLGLNDLFYITRNNDLGGGDDGYRGTRGQSVHYSLPWGYWGLGLTHSSNRYHQSVVGQAQTYVYSGTSTTTEVKLSRVLARDAVSKTSASLKAFQRTSNNYIDDTEIEIQRRVVGGWESGVAHKTQWGDTRLDGSLNYKVGTKDFGALPAPEEASGTGTSRFGLTLLEVSLQTPLKWLQSQPLSYSAMLRWQQNLTPLTPQDRFAIGGRYTVRGFDGVNVLSAERGMLLRNEISAPWLGSSLSAFLGLDYGYVDGASSEQLAGKQLAGSALGLRGAWRQLNYEVFVGTPLEKPQGFRTDSTVAGFNLILTL